MKRTTKILFALLLAGLMLNGCKFDLASSSSWTPGHIVSSYAYKDGPESTGFDAKAGQVFSVDYSATVSSGELDMVVSDPDNEKIWSESFTRDGSGKAQIVLPKDGYYTISVIAMKTSGGFQMNWSVK